MKKQFVIWMLVALVMAVALVGCGLGDNANQNGGEAEELPPVAVIKAQEALAAELNVDVAEVAIISQEQTEWTDSCLGLGGPAESCLAVITPGWLVMLEVDGTTYEVRTDELGDIVRIKS